MKLGLVLEGGAMRGMYTAAILDGFLENGVSVDGIVGVSAGALFGVNYLSGQAGRVIRYNKRFNRDKNYMGLRPLLREGNVVNTRYAYYDVPYILDPFDDEAYMRSGIPLYAVVTDLYSGMPKYIQIKSVLQQMDTLRASGSMPFLSKPVQIGSRMYLDGGISDSIPFAWLQGQGYDALIVILTRDPSYRKGPIPRPLADLYSHKYPNLAARLRERHIRYRQELEALARLEKSGQAFVIRPSRPIKIRRIEKDPEKLQAVYDLGKDDLNARLDALRSFIANKA